MGALAEQARPRGAPPEYRWKPGQSGNPAGRKPGHRSLRGLLLDGARKTLEQLEAIATAALERAKTEGSGRDAAALLGVAKDATELVMAYRLGKPWDGRPEDLDRQDESEQEPAAVLAMPPLVAPGAP